MPPLLHPSPPPSKEPPDKTNTYLPLSAPRPPIDTSTGMPPSQPQLQPPASPSIRPPFSSFFTLIHDTATATTHHPRNVHYIFSDDDPSLLTTACLSALSPSPQPDTHSYPSPSRPQNPSTSSTSSAASKSPSSSTAATDKKPCRGREGERENRILLLDLDDSGTSVAMAHSLSSSWQILSTSLTPAPTWDESPSEPSPPNAGGAGFMLKISGTDGRQMNARGIGTGLGLGQGREGKAGAGKGAGSYEGLTEAEFQALMLEFDSRMKVLRTVVDAGAEVGQRHGAGGEAEGEGTVERGEEDTGSA